MQYNKSTKYSNKTTVECYGCHQIVSDLEAHRPFCTSKPKEQDRKPAFSSTVECYNCRQLVADLRAHRPVCPLGASTTAPMQPSFQRKEDIPTAESSQVKRSTSNHAADRDLSDFSDSRDVFVLVDVSGSMKGARLSHAKEALARIHETLSDNDRLSVITFDSNAYLRLKPRPNGQLKRQEEFSSLLERLFAQGSTALYDAIVMAIGQIRSKERSTLIVALTDGEDNASKNSLDSVERLVASHANVRLDIVHISSNGYDRIPAFSSLSANGRGSYVTVTETEIVLQMVTIVRRVVLK